MDTSQIIQDLRECVKNRKSPCREYITIPVDTLNAILKRAGIGAEVEVTYDKVQEYRGESS